MSTSAQAEGRESARGSIARNDQGSRRASTAGTRGRGDGRTTDGLSNALGWFSVGLGLAQIVSPGSVARLIGVRDDDRNRRIMRAVGMRELASGVGIFAKDRPAEFLWGRVAGDLMDLAMLGNALSGDGNERPRTSIAIAAVLGVGALDYLAAQRMSQGSESGASAERGGESGIFVHSAITVNRPIEEVYGFWRDFENLPRFMKHLESVRDLGGGRSHWKATAPAGKTVEWDAEMTEDRPDEQIAWRSLPDADVDNQGTVRFVRAPGNRGTEVHVEMRYDPPGGRVGATLAKLFREEPGQQVSEDLRRFKQVLETGEVIVSDASVRRGPHPGSPPEGRPTVVSYEPDIVRERSDEAAATTTSNRDRHDTHARDARA